MRAWPLLLLLLMVSVDAVEAQAPQVVNVRASPANQRVDLTWDPALDASKYTVDVYDAGQLLVRRDFTTTSASFGLTNGRTYTFVVTAFDARGEPGPGSFPVAATPGFERDLHYLAAGLIATWASVFGYVVYLGRREAALDRKLEQLLAHRGGRTP